MESRDHTLGHYPAHATHTLQSWGTPTDGEYPTKLTNSCNNRNTTEPYASNLSKIPRNRWVPLCLNMSNLNSCFIKSPLQTHLLSPLCLSSHLYNLKISQNFAWYIVFFELSGRHVYSHLLPVALPRVTTVALLRQTS